MIIALNITNLRLELPENSAGPTGVTITMDAVQASLETDGHEPKFEAWRERLAEALQPLAEKLRQFEAHTPPSTPPEPHPVNPTRPGP